MIKSLLLRLVFVTAFLPTAAFAAEYVFTDLGAVPDQFAWATGKGLDVNSKGYIAGAEIGPTTELTRTAQIGIPGNGVIDTNATLGGTSSVANAINEHDHLTGTSETSAGEFHAFFWDGSNMTDLGTLGGENSHGFAINDAGQVTGESDTSEGTQHAIFWGWGHDA
jgi:probable HAF family extracellular repeat protein